MIFAANSYSLIFLFIGPYARLYILIFYGISFISFHSLYFISMFLSFPFYQSNNFSFFSFVTIHFHPHLNSVCFLNPILILTQWPPIKKMCSRACAETQMLLLPWKLFSSCRFYLFNRNSKRTWLHKYYSAPANQISKVYLTCRC